MVLAELELFQSRSVAPTRRIALGHCTLPASPAPGFGGILLGAVAAAFVGQVDVDLRPDLERLSLLVEHGHRIAQPRLRHRLQTDRVGLSRRVHRLVAEGERVRLDLDTAAGTSPSPQVLAAIYAAGRLPDGDRATVLRVVRRGLLWRGAVDDGLLDVLGGRGGVSVDGLGRFADPEGWALDVLGLRGAPPARAEVQRRFRELLRVAHPDHGGSPPAAAARIAELADARRILLPVARGGPDRAEDRGRG